MAKPIVRISLPTHHPAVAGCKDGDCVSVMARKVKTEELEPVMKDEAKAGERPPPVNTDFHVEDITPHKAAASPKKKMGPMDYLKGKRGKAEPDADDY